MNEDDGFDFLLSRFLGLDPEALRKRVEAQQEALTKLSRESARTPLEGDKAASYLTSVIQTCYPTGISFRQ